MNDVRREITKERFNYLKSLTAEKFKEALDIPIAWRCGYGWYGCRLAEDNGKFYEIHTIGSSCD